MRAATLILAPVTGAMLLLGACASHPPSAPTEPRSVSRLLYCAVSVVESEGYEIGAPPEVEEPEVGRAWLRGPSQFVGLIVWRTRQGEISFRVGTSRSPGFGGSPTDDELLRQRILDRCYR